MPDALIGILLGLAFAGTFLLGLWLGRHEGRSGALLDVNIGVFGAWLKRPMPPEESDVYDRAWADFARLR